MRRELPTASVTTLISDMMRRRLTLLGVILKAPIVYRFLHQQGLKGKQVTPSVDRRRFEVELPNDICQNDALHGLMLLMGDKRRKSYLFTLIDDMSLLITHAAFYLAEGLWPLIYRPCARPCSNGGYHASFTSTTAQPSAPTTWERSPPLWASLWSNHRHTCPRAGARLKSFSAPPGPSFSPASWAIPFGISMRPWSAGLGTFTTSTSIWTPDRPPRNASPARWSASGRPRRLGSLLQKKGHEPRGL
ncbi:hypothetical protein DFAR_4000005 [Desulfarculales bacterium]